MDEQTRTAVEISKLTFLVENLYALVLRELGAEEHDVDRLADEMRRQATALPARTYGPQSSPQRQREHLELLAHRLDSFWSDVRERIRSDQGRNGQP